MSTSETTAVPTPARTAGPSRFAHADVLQCINTAKPPLTAAQALIEADRCYYCHDAPCVQACPTGIDVPSFIARIAQGNTRGAAQVILSANPLGGMCARVCPTEVLCEGACVRHTNEDKPVEIGLLQRHATDHLAAHPGAPLFKRAASTGKRVAVVGSGPAGLACAHGLACLGHSVVILEARSKPGGLNEYGIAAYKTAQDFAQAEVAALLAIGGIELRTGQTLGQDFTLDGLRADFDAVFLGLGLAGVNALGVPEAQATGLGAAVDFIAQVRQASDLAQVPLGRHVVVIGGGMTAVDAAVQARMLGAETATIVYRRGARAMPASQHEQEWAQTQGVLIRHWAAPVEVLASDGAVCGVRFAATQLVDGRLINTDQTFTLPADQVLRAIGQTYVADPAGAQLKLLDGRIQTDAQGQTSLPGVWAGGDCRAGGRDLTVEAVEHGKQAAKAMHAALTAAANATPIKGA
jgi:dihydropyrimidine dehydrogenase (NAD+) subunit PreT